MSIALRRKRMVITQVEIICEETPFLELTPASLDPSAELFTTYVSAPTQFPRFTQERANITNCIQELKKSFNEAEDRQISYAKLRSLLADLRNKVGLDRRGFLRVINMCIDALENTKSELIKYDQIETLEFVLHEMNERIGESDVNELQEILSNAGLKPIPELEGTALLYE